jgi:hypothetical protein
MTGSTNLSTGVVTLTSSGGAAHYGPFTNTTTWGNGSLTNSMTVTPTNVFFTNSAGGYAWVSNGNVFASATIRSVSNSIPLTNAVFRCGNLSGFFTNISTTISGTNAITGCTVTLPEAGVWKITAGPGNAMRWNLTTSGVATNRTMVYRSNNTPATVRVLDVYVAQAASTTALFIQPAPLVFQYVAAAGDVLRLDVAHIGATCSGGAVAIDNAFISAEWMQP